MANNLKLGCDCLGSIHYLDGVVSDSKGEANKMDSVICVHEVDSGIIHKHVNYRTGAGVVARNRELVVQSIITVANYDYVLAWIFNQAGEVSYEVRATGIMSTSPIDDGVDVPWGTVVHPGVLATHHQHIFSLRVDPALDGYCGNRLTYEEAHTMPRDPELNRHGVGFVVEETVIEESGAHDLDFGRNRTFKIQNATATNPVNGKPVGYRIQLPASQPILADKDSFHHKRADFADHAVYVTRYRDGELYAGGKYTNQSRGGAGVRGWADRKENVKDTDLVLWLQFGLTHIPRVEDFPVRPNERLYPFLSFLFFSFFSFGPIDFPSRFSTLPARLTVMMPTCGWRRPPTDHARRDDQGIVETGQLLRQEPGLGRAPSRTDLQPVGAPLRKPPSAGRRSGRRRQRPRQRPRQRLGSLKCE